jgi:hypothetical protein
MLLSLGLNRLLLDLASRGAAQLISTGQCDAARAPAAMIDLSHRSAERHWPCRRRTRRRTARPLETTALPHRPQAQPFAEPIPGSGDTVDARRILVIRHLRAKIIQREDLDPTAICCRGVLVRHGDSNSGLGVTQAWRCERHSPAELIARLRRPGNTGGVLSQPSPGVIVTPLEENCWTLPASAAVPMSSAAIPTAR